MNENLPRIVAEIFAKGGDDLPSRVQRLRTELKKIIESEDGIFGKLHGLLESFRDVIPDEKQRYAAALKALSATSKLDQAQIVRAVAGQIEELKILEKSMMPAGAAWRSDLKNLEAKLKEVRQDLARVRERAAQLEGEEKALVAGMAAREKEAEVLEKTLKDLFTDMGAEIALVKKRIEEFGGEPAAPAAPKHAPAKTAATAEKKEAASKKEELQPAPVVLDPKTQKKCPLCGGIMNLHAADKMWMCYSCGNEEPSEGGAPPAGDMTFGSSAAPESGEEAAPDASSGGPFFDPSQFRGSRAAAEPAGEEYAPKKGSSRSEDAPTKTKTCPVCKKKMNFHPMEQAWRCPHCNYLRRL